MQAFFCMLSRFSCLQGRQIPILYIDRAMRL